RLAPTLLTRSDAYCNDYQWAAIDLVASIRADVVVIANRSAFWTSTDPEQLLVPVLGVLPKNQSEALQIWEAGLEAAINASFERGVERIVLIGPVPEFPGSGPALLRRNAGSLSQQALRERRNAVVAVEQAIVAADPRIIYFDPAPILCPTDPCSQLRDGTWLYSDGDHLNSVGSSFLAPDLQVILESLDR
ncbi:MAG: hypothetical protein IIA01_01920, partial [Proteobacteria bacterium]|nr:hypothetical protein [Pseudomonadota bacterium]